MAFVTLFDEQRSNTILKKIKAFPDVLRLTARDECDKEQPYVKIDDEILCLQPAAP